MDQKEFLEWSLKAAAWGAAYRAGIRQYPVRPAKEPGQVAAKIAAKAPEQAEPMEAIFADFEAHIVPGMTHWQHPGFLAYFPANAAPASVIAEYLVAALAPQCMLWQTSPAATELEGCMMRWLGQAVGLSEEFVGVIQDSASTATLVAALSMREKALNWRGNQEGLEGAGRVRVYAGEHVHSSIERAIWISGIGAKNLVRVPTTGVLGGVDVGALEAQIRADKAAGWKPAGVMATVGATGWGACDPVGAVCEVAHRHGMLVHVDAAWAGSAMICPEFRGLWEGIEQADSLVWNPHKWLGAHFDCSAHFVREPEVVRQTMALQPEYLKTYDQPGVTDYSEWSISLGRRFRALKVWFLLRAYGLQGLRQRIRDHVTWSQHIAQAIEAHPHFELLTMPVLSLFVFAHTPPGVADLDAHNLALLAAINDDGRVYLTQGMVGGRRGLRMQVGQFDATREDVLGAWEVIQEVAADLGDEGA